VVLAATKDLSISRAFLFTFLPLLYAVFFFCHRFVPGILLRRFFRQHYVQRGLLVGCLEKAEAMAQWRAQMASLGVEFVCFSDDSGREAQGAEDALTSLERVVRRQRIAHVVLLGLPENREFVQGLLSICNRHGSRLLVVNGLGGYFARPVMHSSLCGVDVIDVMEEPLEDPLNRLCKRIIDVAVALPVVAFILPPLIVVVWLVHRFQSPGPLFYRQTRSGRCNQPFRIFKFRTMHATRRGQGRQATQGDARVFAFGRFLRRTSLDEIPQFINVLRGDMSVVGPRPHMVIHNRRFCQAMASYHVRAFVKPGITGVAQVRGCRGEAKTDADIEARVRHDLEYIQHWSIWRDIQIILETGRQVFFPPKTAY
jgi:exopolysaccharide biosynthesis polyprenyl glycosylphosphotransferase